MGKLVLFAATTSLAAALLLTAGPAGAASPTGSGKTVTATTTISATPSAFDTTDGDILAITRISGAVTAQIAIGGNFSHVITTDGKSHPARNFAILSELTGAVLYAGNANSYVRAITSLAGTTYVAGNFTAFAGVARGHAAALSPTYALTGWNPAPGNVMRAVAANATGVYLSGDTSAVRKVTLTTGSKIWSRPTMGGDVHALLIYGGFLYVGGLFESYDNVVQHGLVRVSPSTGAVDTTFDAHLRADSGVGPAGAYDGEEIASMTPGPDPTTLVVGDAGHGGVGKSSNEARVLYTGTGATKWLDPTIGDGQAVGLVGTTMVVGYHRNSANTTVPYPYFSAQLELSNGALTSWNPEITGNQSNTDGGNNGVQAIYADPLTQTIFLAGAFTQYNGSSHKSLIAFHWS